MGIAGQYDQAVGGAFQRQKYFKHHLVNTLLKRCCNSYILLVLIISGFV
jgi:hypothetical protein